MGYDSHRSCGWRTGNVPAAAVTTFVMESVGGYASIISNGNEILTDKYGVYMRIGYVYVVVIAAAALGAMLYGNDPSSAGQTIINFINNFGKNGVCPALQ